jgi:hypothetical protein
MSRGIKTVTGFMLTVLFLIVATEQGSAATKQSIKWRVTGDCVDLYEEYQSDYTVYEGESCVFTATVKPVKPSRTVALQWFDSDTGKWTIHVQAKTNKSGVARINADFDTDECWDDASFEFRLGMAKQGASPAITSAPFWITYVYDCD